MNVLPPWKQALIDQDLFITPINKKLGKPKGHDVVVRATVTGKCHGLANFATKAKAISYAKKWLKENQSRTYVNTPMYRVTVTPQD